ncbi:MAG: hypothetical protein MUC47_08885 [Candidatus Kapabacteria bacterium]|jgi:hypothetical protein|nr:hypothetical protein [Candidatus Kapabacteria bacterium]
MNVPFRLLALCLAVLAVVPGVTTAQVAGEDPGLQDTLIVFESPRPLLENGGIQRPRDNAAGIDLLFSGSGWGFGGFYQRSLGGDATAFLHLGISGRRNSDEFENAWLGPIPVVAGKLNRLFMFPVSLGVQYRLFSTSLQESFRPFLSAGAGPTFIVSTPYIRDGQFYEFFSSFGQATLHTRFGAHVGIGSFFGTPSTGSLVGVQVRYYTIPFGGDGLESMRDNPITNFGGIFLSLTVGGMY